MRRTLNLSCILLVLAAVLISSAMAQSAKGSLTGRVADTADAVLPGAQVELLPNAGTATTNNQGEFTLTNLTPGTYTLLISYVGFKPFQQEVTITAGKNTLVKAVIQVSGKGDEVTVYSGRESGEIEAINRTRTAENILQVLPAEVIVSLPNANIADALGRMPSVTIERDEGEGKYVQIRGTEPRLSNVMIDGITIPSPESGVRQIKLDTIPSDLVESIEINKTLQANIDGDGIGGSVNLRTKTATDTPTITFYGLGGYTPILNNGRDVIQSGGTLGKRFGQQKKLGILFGGTYDYNGRGINDIEPSPTAGSATPHYDSMDLRDYVYNRTRYGFAGSLDYKLREGSGVYLRGLYSNFRNWGNKWVITLNDGDVPKYSQDWRRPNMVIANVVAGGNHVFSDSTFSWSVAAGRSRALGGNAGNGGAKYSWAGDSGINCYNDQSVATSVYRPGWSAGCWGSGPDNAFDGDNYKLKSFAFPGQGTTAQVNLTGAADYAKNYTWNGHHGTLAVGFKIRNEHKFDNSYSASVDLGGNLAVSAHPEWASDFTDDNYYDKTYTFAHNLTDYSKVRSWVLANGAITAGTPWSNSGNFDLIERITSGYVMNTIQLSPRFRLVAGVRFEATHVSTLSWDNNSNALDFKAGGDYLDALPSAALKFAIDKSSNLRLVYGRGLARPNPEDITAAVGDTGNSVGGKEEYTLGNPGLKAEYADNFDILYERYLKPIGLLQAGYFYKRLSNPITQELIPITSGPYTGGIYVETVNAGSAHVQGLEVGFQQHLSYLPGPMRFLGISANYSYTESQTSGLLGRSDHPALMRQAPNTWNISPTFDTRKFSMRIGMSYNGAMIYAYQWQDGADSVGVKGPVGDNYLYSHYQIDIQGSYRLPKGLEVYAYGLNLNNEVFGFYNGSPKYVVQREYYKPTYAGGLRYTFNHER